MTTTFRVARRADLPQLVAMLADDSIGATREKPGAFEAAGASEVTGATGATADGPAAEDPARLDPAYVRAFDAIDRNPNDELLLAEQDGRVVGMLQLTILDSITRTGMRRGQIEGVRVATSARGTGLGTELIEEAVRRARDRGCGLVQLTSDVRRTDAIRFYERLGFEASHVGFKRSLASD